MQVEDVDEAPALRLLLRGDVVEEERDEVTVAAGVGRVLQGDVAPEGCLNDGLGTPSTCVRR